MSAGWPDVLAASGVGTATTGRRRRAAPCLRGGGDRVLPAARALGAGRGGARHARGATGCLPSRGRPRRDRARGARAPALHVPRSSSSPTVAEGRSWYGGPGAGELVEWRPVLERAGVAACPNRVAAVYLELAVLVRALQGLEDAARMDVALDRSVALGGALRPPRHAARHDGRRPARARRVTPHAR